MYPYVTGSTGSYTLKVSASRSGGSSSGTITTTKTLVDVDETGVSTQQSYSFTLAADADVSVALTDLTIDFDCRAGSSLCTNRWGTRDDSWTGRLGAGTHSVVVYPYRHQSVTTGDYSLLVTSTETVTYVATPMTAVGRICDADEQGNAIEDTCQTIYGDGITVTADPGPPNGARPGQGNPPPTTPPNPSPNPTPTTTNTSDVIGSLKNVIQAENLDCRSMNFSMDDRLGSTHGGTSTSRPGHGGIDMQTMGQHSNFYAPVAGTLSYHEQPGSCGHHAKITRADGTYVIICHLDPAHDVDSGPVAAGALIGRDGFGSSGAGNSQGPHLHLAYKRSVNEVLNPFDLWGGMEAMRNEEFTFNDSDPATCEESE